VSATPRRRFWIEAALAVTALALFVLTLTTAEWIEFLFGVDPDGGDGSLEVLVLASFLVAAGGFALVARTELLRASVAPGASRSK
jgi:hypothetical protein